MNFNIYVCPSSSLSQRDNKTFTLKHFFLFLNAQVFLLKHYCRHFKKKRFLLTKAREQEPTKANTNHNWYILIWEVKVIIWKNKYLIACNKFPKLKHFFKLVENVIFFSVNCDRCVREVSSILFSFVQMNDYAIHARLVLLEFFVYKHFLYYLFNRMVKSRVKVIVLPKMKTLKNVVNR